jgi:ketopantoate reductase
MGAGAVGCYFGAMLGRSGVPVKLIGRELHVEAIARDGLLLHGLGTLPGARLKTRPQLVQTGHLNQSHLY